MYTIEPFSDMEDIKPPKEYYDPIKAARYQFKVKYGNRKCPVPGCINLATDAHHVLVTRHPDDPALYVPENMVLVCQYHHVPPSPRLNYFCVLWMLTKGRRKHKDIKRWIQSLPFKGERTLPDFYYQARKDLVCGRRKDRHELLRESQLQD
jgi:hypothetical protein